MWVKKFGSQWGEVPKLYIQQMTDGNIAFFTNGEDGCIKEIKYFPLFFSLLSRSMYEFGLEIGYALVTAFNTRNSKTFIFSEQNLWAETNEPLLGNFSTA